MIGSQNTLIWVAFGALCLAPVATVAQDSVPTPKSRCVQNCGDAASGAEKSTAPRTPPGLSRSRDMADFLLTQGIDFYNRSDFANAIASFEDALLGNPGDEDIEEWIKRARSAMSRRRGASVATATGTVSGSRRDTRAVSVLARQTEALATALGWSGDQRTRLMTAFSQLTGDGAPARDVDIVRTWGVITRRGQQSALAAKASAGSGPGLPAAGLQAFDDCAVFAVANASNLPYSVVATRAAGIIRLAEWRTAAERANPQRTIERGGLTGNELLILAEAMGQAEVVPSTSFAATLRAGRRIMVNVVPPSGDIHTGHEVVLTRTFEHEGATWYEMIDSNQGPWQRRYLSAGELSTILQERGVALRPNPGTSPSLLR
jgi:hypothetical protein